MTTIIVNILDISRNKISFVGKNIPFKLCSPKLQNFLREISSEILPDINYSIQITNLDEVSIVLDGSFSINSILNAKIKSQIKYLETCDGILIDEDLHSIYNDKLITRYYNTFIQTDDNIRDHIYSILTKYTAQNLLLIGGECYVYSKLLIAKNVDVFSDLQSICNDVTKNNKYANVNLVNYNNISLNKTTYYDFAVLNVSKTGLGKRLCSELLNTNIKCFAYISCNERTFIIDSEILEPKFINMTRYIYKNSANSFSVTLNIFSQKSWFNPIA